MTDSRSHMRLHSDSKSDAYSFAADHLGMSRNGWWTVLAGEKSMHRLRVLGAVR